MSSAMNLFNSLTALLILCFCPFTLSQTQYVLSTVVYTRYGDRTPHIVRPAGAVLSPLGARQLYDAGSHLRSRYLTSSLDGNGGGTLIRGMSPFVLDHDEINITSTADASVIASAQAFMQGLYPPLSILTNQPGIDGQAELANGTQVSAPLGGYQYPDIRTAPTSDANSIWVDGVGTCPAYKGAMVSYYNSSEFTSMFVQSSEFYRSIYSGFLEGIFEPNAVGYFDAYDVNEYLEYAYVHNQTVAQTLTAANRSASAAWADDWVFEMYGNNSATGGVGNDVLRAIAGRTLSTWVLSAFIRSIETRGATNKMNLLFGSYEPMVSFAALAELTSPRNPAFYHTPGPASSFIFELVASVSDGDTSDYPDMSSLFVRFFYQDSSEGNSSLRQYPLFGDSPSEDLMSFSDFMAKMEVLKVRSVASWCDACGSLSTFCQPFVASSSGSRHNGLQPAVAGVIGALVTLLVVALLIAALLFLGGFRFRREDRRSRSGLAGFKGAEKLASDQDLTIPKGGAAATIANAGADGPRGHERTGSWELREQAKHEEAQLSGIDRNLASSGFRKSSLDDNEIRVDPYTSQTKPQDWV